MIECLIMMQWLCLDNFTVEYSGPMQINGTQFLFVRSIQDCPTCWGWYNFHKRNIEIKSNLTVGETFLTCNHEMFHKTPRKGFTKVSQKKTRDDHRLIGRYVLDLPEDVRYPDCKRMAEWLYVHR